MPDKPVVEITVPNPKEPTVEVEVAINEPKPAEPAVEVVINEPVTEDTP